MINQSGNKQLIFRKINLNPGKKNPPTLIKVKVIDIKLHLDIIGEYDLNH